MNGISSSGKDTISIWKRKLQYMCKEILYIYIHGCVVRQNRVMYINKVINKIDNCKLSTNFLHGPHMNDYGIYCSILNEGDVNSYWGAFWWTFRRFLSQVIVAFIISTGDYGLDFWSSSVQCAKKTLWKKSPLIMKQVVDWIRQSLKQLFEAYI